MRDYATQLAAVKTMPIIFVLLSLPAFDEAA